MRKKGRETMGRLSAPDLSSMKRRPNQTLGFLCKIVRDLFTALDVTEFCSGDGEIEVKGDSLDVLGGLWAEECDVAETSVTLSKFKIEMPGFAVGMVVHHRNYPHEPDDWEPVEVARFADPYKAAAKLAEMYWEDRIRQALEVISYDEADIEADAANQN